MPDKAEKKRNPKTTLAIALACLVLGIPVAGVAINLESTFMPEVPIGARELDSPDGIETLKFDLINGPHIAIFAAAFMTIAAATITMLGSVILRHVSKENVPVGIASFGFAVINQVAQLVILALVYILNSVHPVSANPNDVRFVDGKYETNGKEFTRETWACTMKTLFRDTEGTWAINACSEYHYARYTLIIQVVVAFLLVMIAYWPVRKWMFGRSRKMTAMEQLKAGHAKA
ncbi:hypothetical protein BS50DRAFT_34784 [Corynespora cassiicola Philippines]|uniref:Uncharacterized protein n=1 Tax=Corynespora cassiicola Philippines TaxID=1448308 RepID=A0A2T2PC08_CORCC|nr:hypothetical protein BS50DRAFT_34784 [Corynespora cassiicola Philippines]